MPTNDPLGDLLDVAVDTEKRDDWRPVVDLQERLYRARKDALDQFGTDGEVRNRIDAIYEAVANAMGGDKSRVDKLSAELTVFRQWKNARAVAAIGT